MSPKEVKVDREPLGGGHRRPMVRPPKAVVDDPSESALERPQCSVAVVALGDPPLKVSPARSASYCREFSRAC